MSDEQVQCEPVSLGSVGFAVGDVVSRLKTSDESHVRKDSVVEMLANVSSLIRRGIQWNGLHGTADPKIAELRADNERLKLRNEQMAATAQDGIDQRDALRREVALAENSLKMIRLDRDERREEIEHLKRELAEARSRTVWTVCIYCGKEFAGDNVGEVTAHIESCSSHPLAKCKAELERVRKTLGDWKEVRTRERAKDCLAVDDYRGEATFHKERFDECHRQKTFLERLFIVHRYGSLWMANSFAEQWKWKPIYAASGSGDIKGICVPADWTAPDDPPDEPQSEAPESTRTAWGDVGSPERPISQFDRIAAMMMGEADKEAFVGRIDSIDARLTRLEKFIRTIGTGDLGP